MWASIGYLSGGNGRIEGLYFSTESPYANYLNPRDPFALHTFYLTDTFNINFQFNTETPRFSDRRYLVTIMDAGGNVKKEQIFTPANPTEKVVNLTGIFLSPAVFPEEGVYEIRTSVLVQWGGAERIAATNISRIRVERAVVDILAEYKDQIFLQTSETPYHHEILVHGKVEEAGEGALTQSVPVNVYWLEQDGSYAFYGTFSTNTSGEISTTINCTNTLPPNQMRLKLNMTGDSIYRPADSDQKTALWSQKEDIRHTIMNAGNCTTSPLDAYTEGAPQVLELTNEDHHIYSPNGGNGDIEDYNFEVNPFEGANTFGFQAGNASWDGWDTEITRAGIEAPAAITYPATTPANFTLASPLAPSEIKPLVGNVTDTPDLAAFVNNDGTGMAIRFVDTLASDGTCISTISCEFMFPTCGMPEEQVDAISLLFGLGFGSGQDMGSLQLYYASGTNPEELLLATSLVDVTAFWRNISLPLNQLEISGGISIRCMLANPANADLAVLFDQAALQFSFTPNATRAITWDESNHRVDFMALGGTTNWWNPIDLSTLSMGCEVMVPAVPFYSLFSVIVTISLTLEMTRFFGQPMGSLSLAIYTTPGSASASHEHYPISTSTGSGTPLTVSRNITFNLKPLAPPELFYLAISLQAGNLMRGDQVIAHLEEVIVAARYARDDASFSNVEDYFVSASGGNDRVTPASVTYPTITESLALTRVLNAQVPYATGPATFPCALDPHLLTTGTATLTGTTWNLATSTITLTPLSLPLFSSFTGSPPVESGTLDDLRRAGDNQSYAIELVTTSEVEHICNASGLESGHEYTLVGDGLGGWVGHNGSIELGPNRACLIDIPISRNYSGIVQIQLRLLLRNTSIPGSYAVSSQRIAAPAEWTEPSIIGLIPSPTWLGTASTPVSVDITNPLPAFQVLTLDITGDFIAALKEGKSSVTLYLNTTADNPTDFLATWDLASQGMAGNLVSGNHANVTLYDAPSACFQFLDAALVSTPATLTLRVKGEGCNLSVGSNVNGTYRLLDTIPEDEADFEDKSILISPESDMMAGMVSIVLGFELPVSADQNIPTARFDLVSLSYNYFWASFNIVIPASCLAPFDFVLAGLPIPASITGGSISLETSGGPRLLWNITAGDYASVQDRTWARAWGIQESENLVYNLSIEYFANEPCTLSFTSIGLHVASTNLTTRSASGWAGSTFVEFGSTVIFNSLLVTWDSHAEGYLRVTYQRATTLSEPPAHRVTVMLSNSAPGTFESLVPLQFDGAFFAARYLVVDFELVVMEPGARFGPVLFNITVHANRTAFGSAQSLARLADGDEIGCSIPTNATAEVFVSFIVNSGRLDEPALILSADYVEVPGHGALATLSLANYEASIELGNSSGWVMLQFEKRSSNTIDANQLPALRPYVHSNGTLRVRYRYSTRDFFNLHLDYAGIVFCAEIDSLLNASYFHHLDLPRASEIIDVFPTGIDKEREQLGTETTIPTNGSSYNNATVFTDSATGNPRGIELVRTLTDYASGNLAMFPVNGSSQLSICPSILWGEARGYQFIARDEYTDFSHETPNEGIVTQQYVVRIPVGVPAGMYDVFVYLVSASKCEQYYQFLFWQLHYTWTGYTVFSLSPLTSTDPNSYDWLPPPTSTTGGTPAYDTVLSQAIEVHEAGGQSYFNLYVRGKHRYCGSVARLATQRYYLDIALGRLDIKLARRTELESSVNVSTSMLVNVPVNSSAGADLRGIYLNGSIEWDGWDAAQSYFIAGSQKYNFNIATMSYAISVFNAQSREWDPFPVAGADGQPCSQTDVFVGTDVGHHKGSFPISRSQSSGVFLEEKYVSTLDDGTQIIQLKVDVWYFRKNWVPFFTGWSSGSTGGKVDLCLATTVSGARAIPLLDDQVFTNNPLLQSFDFGAIFEVSTRDLITANYSVTARDAWYFATHLKYSITPQWSDRPGMFTAFGGTLYYSFTLAMEKNVGGGATTWQVFNPGVCGGSRAITSGQAIGGISEEYQIILAESEDRSSPYDPNALRLGAVDIEDYFIGGDTLRFRINLTVTFNSVVTFDAHPFNATDFIPHKQIAVTFESYTTIDNFRDPPVQDNLHELQENVTLPVPLNSALADKLSYARVKLGGTIALHSVELHHFSTQGLGVRVGTITPAGGREVLAEYSLPNQLSMAFAGSLLVPRSKLQGLSRFTLYLEVGFWGGRFVGFYDDMGVVEARLDYLRYEFVYSTGFLDAAAGRAYVDQELSLDFGGPLPTNVTSIIVTAEVDGVIQGLVDIDGQLQEVVSFSQPRVKIYNWASGTYDPMAVFALGGSRYQFVLDVLTSDPRNYSDGSGHAKLLVILDGRAQGASETPFENAMYHAQIVIHNLQAEFACFNVYPEARVFNKVKPAGDMLIPDPWDLPSFPFRRDIYLGGSLPNEPCLFTIDTAFADGPSAGLWPYELEVLGNASPLAITLIPSEFNGPLITRATLEVNLPGLNSLYQFACGKVGIRIFWGMSYTGFVFVNASSTTGLFYNGLITAGKVDAYFTDLPFTANKSGALLDVWNLDFSWIPVEVPAGISQELPYLFTFANQYAGAPANLTGAALQFAITSASSLRWQVGFYSAHCKAFDYYAVAESCVQQVYFAVPQSYFYIIPLTEEQFWEYCSGSDELLVKLRVATMGDETATLNLNLLELKLVFDEHPVNLANQTYLEHIAGGSSGHFAQVITSLTPGADLQFGDAINVTITPDLAYDGPLANQKVDVLVNSSDGWMLLKEGLTNEDGLASFIMDTADIYTKDLLGPAYPRLPSAYSPYMWNENFTNAYYPSIRYTVDGITRIDNLAVASTPYTVNGENEVSLQLNLSFPAILSERGEPFHLEEYSGIRVGVLFPYDEIVQSITVYLVDTRGDRHEVVLEGAPLLRLYNDPNDGAVFINGTRLIHTFMDVGLRSTWLGALGNISVLGVRCQRKSYHLGPYQGMNPPTAVGIASVHLIHQLNNFSYNNFGFISEPASQVAIWYEGDGQFYSSWIVIPDIHFRRLPTTLAVRGGTEASTFDTTFGNTLKVSVDVQYAGSIFVPILSLLVPVAFLLLVLQEGKKVIAGYEVVSGDVYNLGAYSNYTFDFRVIAEAGSYSGAEVFWYGNGLFQNTSCLLSTPLVVDTAPSFTEFDLDNLAFDYGYAASIEGCVYDGAHEALKESDITGYWEDFEGGEHAQVGCDASGIKVEVAGGYTVSGRFSAGQGAYTYEYNLEGREFEIPFVNAFTFSYWTSTLAASLRVTIWYKVPGINDLVSRERVFSPSLTGAWVTVFMDTQFQDRLPDGATGPALIAGIYAGISSDCDQNATFKFDDLKLLHTPVVYLQARCSDRGAWHNVTMTSLQLAQETASSFALPIFTNRTQFLLNNPLVNRDGLPLINGELEAGDYQVRAWFAGNSRFYNSSCAEAYLRVRPIETAVFYVPDGDAEPTRDGYYAERQYASTTVFALEAERPFTLLDIGYTWGDVKNLTFVLSPRDGGFNGIPNKPVWLQVGIVPATVNGLQGRDYFADYYPIVRNVTSGKLVEQPYVVQGKYAKPVTYDYYDAVTKQVRIYGPYLWMVALTDAEGRATFPLDFGPSLMDDLTRIFPGMPINNVDHDLYIRAFYVNNFAWADMAVLTGKPDVGSTFLCSGPEDARDPAHVFTVDDVTHWQLRTGSAFYHDGVYGPSYAEGVLDCRQEDLHVTGRDTTVTNRGEEADAIPLIAYLSEYSTLPDGQEVSEGVPQDAFNRLNETTAYFMVADGSTGEVLVGDPRQVNQFLIPASADPSTGRLYAELNKSKILDLAPGYYDVQVYVPETPHYHDASGTYRLLLKSAFTYDFTSPTALTDFSYALDDEGRPFFYNASKGGFDDETEEDITYPVVRGCAWLAADPNPTCISDGAGITITINGYPILDQVLTPFEGAIPFEMSLEYFAGEVLHFNVSTWTNETQVGRDSEYPHEGDADADWVFVNATIYEPTFANPVDGIPEYDIVANFMTLNASGKVATHNVCPSTSPKAVSIHLARPVGCNSSSPALLIYPTALGTTATSVEITVPYNAIRAPFAALDTNGNATDGEELLAGRVIPHKGFNNGFRHAFVQNPLITSKTQLVTAILVDAVSAWRGIEYQDVYCPYKGMFEAIAYAPFLPLGQEDAGVEFVAELNSGMPDASIIASAVLTGTSPQKFALLAGILPEDTHSTYQNITLKVRSWGGTPVQAFWVCANVSGYEDLAFASAQVPFGRAALFSSNFLYYYIPSAAALGLDANLVQKVWFRCENAPGCVNTPQPHHDLAPSILKIFHQVGPAEMSRNWQQVSAGITKAYTFAPQRGIFARAHFFNLAAITGPEVHAGYLSLYGSDADGKLNYENLLGQRKVTLVASPASWENQPVERALRWQVAAARYKMSIAKLDFDANARQTLFQVFYVQDPSPEDLVYEHWNYTSFSAHWNRSQTTHLGWDFWYNENVYAAARFSNTSAPEDAVLDFYPANGSAVDWSAYQQLVVNFAVNDSCLVSRFRVQLYGLNEIPLLTVPKEFIVQDNTSRNYPLDLSGVDLRAVTRVDLVAVANQTRLNATASNILITTEGLALPSPSKQVRLGVTFANGTRVESHSVPRCFFNHFDPFEFAVNNTPGGSPVVQLDFTGTLGAEITLAQLAILQEYEVEGHSCRNLLFEFDFDPRGRDLTNINRFIGGIDDVTDLWEPGMGVIATDIPYNFSRVRYTDTNLDGTCDRVERWEDYDHNAFEDGIGDFYALDAENDGIFEFSTVQDVRQQTIVLGENQSTNATKRKTVESVTRLVSTQAGIISITEEFTSERTFSDGCWSPACRTHEVRLATRDDSRPFYIYTEVDEWHRNLGMEDYEYHQVSRWNATAGAYDIQEWHDWAVTLNVAFLGEIVETYTNVVGILDRGVTKVQLDPAAPIDNNWVAGTILWTCSYAPGQAIAPFYDVGLVILNDTRCMTFEYGITASFGLGKLRDQGYAFCIGVILDLNRDHVWQVERPDVKVGESFYDTYIPIWELSLWGRGAMRDLAQAVAIQEWMEATFNEQAMAQTEISMLMSVGLSAIATYFLGFIGPFVGSLATSVLNQILMQPYVYPLLYSESERQAQQRLAGNQNALMLTQVPAPLLVQKLGGAGGDVAPDAVFRYYKDTYQGYEIPVLGSFRGSSSGLAPESTEGSVLVNGRIWLPELQALQFLDPTEFLGLIWSYIQDPFKLAEYDVTAEKMGTPAEANAFRYETFVDQREVLTQAYEKVLGCAPATHVVLYPTRQGGRPVYIAMVDDPSETGGMSRFWNSSSPLVNVADRNIVAYTAKFSAFMGTSLEVALAQLSMTVMIMVIQMELTAWATSEVTAYKQMKTSGGGILAGDVVAIMGRNGFSNLWQELLSEIFFEEFILHSAGNALERAIQRGGPLGNTGTEKLLLGWTLGDCLEWAEAFLMMQHNYRKYSRQHTQIEAEDTLQKYVAGHPGETPDLETILKYFPQLAQRVVAKAFAAGSFDEAKFQQIIKETSKMNLKMWLALKQVSFVEFHAKNDATDVEIRKECKRFLKQEIISKGEVTIEDLLLSFKAHMTEEINLLVSKAYFKLRLKFHGIDNPIIIDPNEIEFDSFKKLPFTLLLANPNIEEISFVDPMEKGMDSEIPSQYKFDSRYMISQLQTLKHLHVLKEFTSQDILNRLESMSCEEIQDWQPYRFGRTKLTPEIKAALCDAFNIDPRAFDGDFVSDSVISYFSRLGIHSPEDAIYIARYNINLETVKSFTNSKRTLQNPIKSFYMILQKADLQNNPDGKTAMFVRRQDGKLAFSEKCYYDFFQYLLQDIVEIATGKKIFDVFKEQMSIMYMGKRISWGDGTVIYDALAYSAEDPMFHIAAGEGKFRIDTNAHQFLYNFKSDPGNYDQFMDKHSHRLAREFHDEMRASFIENSKNCQDAPNKFMRYFVFAANTEALNDLQSWALANKQEFQYVIEQYYRIENVDWDAYWDMAERLKSLGLPPITGNFMLDPGYYAREGMTYQGAQSGPFTLYFSRIGNRVQLAEALINYFNALVPVSYAISDLFVENLLEALEMNNNYIVDHST